MRGPKKDSVKMSLEIERSISDRLDEFCRYSGQTKTAATERALDQYMKTYYEQQELLQQVAKR